MLVITTKKIRTDKNLDLAVSGHVLSIGGEFIDLSRMVDGDMLPLGSVGHDYIVSDIVAHGEDIHLTIAHPDDNPAIGKVVDASQEISIDWDQLETADDRAQKEWDSFIASARYAVQSHIDEVSRSRNYHDGAHLAGYVNSTVPQWSQEAAAFVSWRDTVWLHVYDLWASPPTDGELSIPALMATLPEIVWP